MAMFAALNVSQDQTAICINGPCAASSVPKNTVKTGTVLPALLTKEEHVSSCMSKNFESDPIQTLSLRFPLPRSSLTAFRTPSALAIEYSFGGRLIREPNQIEGANEPTAVL